MSDKLESQLTEYNRILIEMEDDIPPSLEKWLGMDIDDEKTEEMDYIQWAKIGKNNYFPEGKVKLVKELKPGVYDIAWSRSREVYYAVHKKLSLDELFIFDDPIQDKILSDIKTFWERKDQFKKYKYAYKRGLLLTGSAGNGKSSIINLLCKELIDKHKGVIFFLDSPKTLDPFITFMQNNFRHIQPETKVICVIEDIEAFTQQSETEGLLLNLLDGMNRMENIVTIATCNYPEQLKERILNRPSRFDRRYEIKNPNDSIRLAYFKHKLKPEDLEEIDLNYWVKKTKGFTLAHLGEVVKSVCALGNDFDETVKELKEMSKKVSSFDFNKDDDEKGIGFKTTPMQAFANSSDEEKEEKTFDPGKRKTNC